MPQIRRLLALSAFGFFACTGGRVDTGGSSHATAQSNPGAPAGATAPGGATTPSDPNAGLISGPACGYMQAGNVLSITADISVCVPPSVCHPENCPPALGTCQQNRCVMHAGYKGIQTLPQAWATYYCQLSTGGCNGVSQIEPPLTTATKLAKAQGVPLCEGAQGTGACAGIAASSPVMVGNSQSALDPQTKQSIRPWGLGLSEASNVCYKLTGPGGDVFVALTDRCGGYCRCGGSNYQECGGCITATDLTPNCPCVGTAPGIADACCGQGCAQTVAACDWCATNNHPHFDLDQASFAHLCGAQATQGSCQITKVGIVACNLGVSWPPP